jgi:kynurenine formamidase
VRIVDLTHTFDDGMPVFPGLPEPSFRAIANVPDDGYAMTELHIDVSGREPGPIGRAELEPWLEDVRAGDIVFMHSDNSRNWGTPAYWTGWSYPDAEAAQALIGRGISAIGFDGPSADPVDSTSYDLHRIWLSAGRMIIENVANLDQLPHRVQVVVAPLKLRNSNGAPARILALVPD